MFILVLIAISLFSLTTQHLPKMMRSTQFKPGGPENMSIGEVPLPQLRPGEVLIKVYMSAINRADTSQRKGLYPSPPGESDILGLEAAGSVEMIGPGCSSKLNKGDRVMALLAGGGNAEYVAAHEDLILQVPTAMTYREAAAIPEVWLTAYQLLFTVGNVQPNESVLIHAGASGVGTSAVQLTRAVGKAIPIVTAGSQEKINTALSLHAAAGFNYKEGPFAEKVVEFTKGHGIDLILDCVGGSYWQQNLDTIAIDGRWVLYGLMGGGSVDGNILQKLMKKRVTLQASTLRTRSIKYKAALVESFRKNALPKFASGELKPIIDSEFPLEKIADAHRLMESNKNTGKILIKVRDEDREEL
ncbi:quinone oxidoreductase PIG3-like [Lineus longissimus]|uniref:quinone oxidoreductase PIG3-like n=1 Tax=Lineus longissimus TaxID=88925 RepID=UPI002B4F6C79